MLGWIILALSLLGYNSLVRVLGVELHLSWLTSVLLQVLALYVFAMCGALNLGLQIVTWGGVLAFAVIIALLILGRITFPFVGTHLFDVWMIALGGVMANVLYHSPLIHYDNYTQWALIVKFMNFTGRLPGAHDPLITYTSYPPATGLFITHVVRLIGFSDGAMILGQFIIIWAALYAIFGVLRDKTRGLMAFVLCFVISISNVFNIAIRMNNLLVDYILPVIAVAGIAGVYIYRKRPGYQLSFVVIDTASILLVKNSGTFFVAMIIIYYLYARVHYSTGNWGLRTLRGLVMTAIAGLGAYLPFAWWNAHVHATFSLSKHEISATAYKSQLAHETTAQIMGIGRKIVRTLLSGHSLSMSGVILINVALLAGWICIRLFCRRKNSLLKLTILTDLGLVIYVISLFGMYVLAMPYNEAKMIDGFERYMSSAVIFFLFVGAMAAVVEMDYSLHEQRFTKRTLRSFSTYFSKNLYQVASFVLMIFSIIMMFSETNGIEYNNQMNKNALPQQMKRIMRQRTTVNHDKVVIVDPHADDVADYYTGYVGRYFFFSDKVVGQEDWNMSAKQFKQAVLAYQYVAIPEWHRTFSAMVKEVWGQSIKTGTFKVTQNGLQRVH
ncbi:ABC transporter permease [Lacticaseibacillus zhaodongensis]|uniref:ABC transporter permease n=1 Tax=Lacticaseibacillus zhaodongensis TaxID=2668065 RepID=UPI001E591DF2|nr:ABC transporter permease [Lacticaseibacillus zhaodongensis]